MGRARVLPGVTIEATNGATGAVRTATSGVDGLFNLPLLQPGDYTVKASLAGFRSAQREGVRVTVTETARVAFELAVGEITRNRERGRRRHADRNQQCHARHRHRRAEGRGPAAQRPEFHAARDADSWRRGAACRAGRTGRRRHAGRLRQRHGRIQRERHAQPVEQLPAGRRHQQRHVQHGLRAAPAARRDRGVQDSHQRVLGGVRAQRRLGGQRGDQIGQQHRLRRGLGVQPRRCVAGAQLLRGAEPAEAEAQAEPVRRCRSADRS